MIALTGLQPTNTLHIGNLFGALLPAVELQKTHKLFLMIPDYHAITVEHDPKTIKANIRFAVATYLACGIDPKKTVIFQQSRIPAHTELGWVMETLTSIGEAERMTQFKDKSNGKAKVSVGLFTYPMLMAADILLYKTNVVPVGADQKQHVELARDLAERFNRTYGETFVIPEPLIRTSGARIRSLTEPEKKMSKSAPNAKSYLSVMDDDDILKKKIMSAVTDSERRITADPTRLGLHNLLTIFSLVSGHTIDGLAVRYENAGMKELKEDLADAVVGFIAPKREAIKTLLKDEGAIDKIIIDGSREAEKVANQTMKTVRERLGLSL